MTSKGEDVGRGMPVLESARPFVSIIVPVRNERRYIDRCLTCIYAQDYPGEMEVIVVDGMSDDGTREILADWGSRHLNLRILDNPGRIVPTAMNIGIRAARGDLVVRVDARCFIASDYVRQCVAYLCETGAQNVGGRQQAIGGSHIARAIALATCSPFGIGNSKFHYSTREQFVDTVYLGAYPKRVLELIGMYDESLVRNQDYELNYRLRKMGGRIFFTPAIRSVYQGRTSWAGLARQYFQYGFWKFKVLTRHPASLQPRQLVPPLFVACVALSAMGGAFLPALRWLLAAIVLSYALLSVAVSLGIAARHGWRYLFLLPVTFAILHVCWGTGFLWGMGHHIVRADETVRQEGTYVSS